MVTENREELTKKDFVKLAISKGIARSTAYEHADNIIMDYKTGKISLQTLFDNNPKQSYDKKKFGTTEQSPEHNINPTKIYPPDVDTNHHGYTPQQTKFGSKTYWIRRNIDEHIENEPSRPIINGLEFKATQRISAKERKHMRHVGSNYFNPIVD